MCKCTSQSTVIPTSRSTVIAFIDRDRTCSERILARGLGHIPRFALVLASTGYQDLAGLEDLHLSAGAGARVDIPIRTITDRPSHPLVVVSLALAVAQVANA